MILARVAVFLVMYVFPRVYSIDYKALMIQRIIMCGPNSVCDIEQFQDPSFNLESYKDLHKCPPCYCDNECIPRGDCCPDKFFSLPPKECVNVTIIQANEDKGRLQYSRFLMVNSCPLDSDVSLKSLCEGEKDTSFRLQNPPVTSNTSMLSYSNKFCALCNKETDFEFWNLDINCEEPSDFNFLSTFQEVVDLALANKCVFQSFPSEHIMAHNCHTNSTSYFDRCNKTGLWKDPDKNIKSACDSHFFEKDTFFKNTFCRLCNPSVRLVPLVSTCNKTGAWQPHNGDIQNACNSYPTSAATFPYKNIFCYFCNRNNEQNMYHFYDIYSHVTAEEFQIENGTFMFHYYFNNQRMNMQYFDIIMEKAHDKNGNLRWVNRSSDIVTASGRSVNITSLIHKHISLTASLNLCNKDLIPEVLRNLTRNCSCDPSCIFTKIQDCCDDVQLLYPTTCTSRMALSGLPYQQTTDTKYVLTNGCFQRSTYPEFAVNGCEGDRDDIFSTLPMTELSNNILYKNFYCLSCNQLFWMNDSIQYLHDPWDVDVMCETFLEYKFYLSFNDLLKTVKEMGCRVKYYPIKRGLKSHPISRNFHPKSCVYNKNIQYTKCNQTNQWPELDEDVKWACEERTKESINVAYGYDQYTRGIFKNNFCILCNPDTNTDITINSCNSSIAIVNYSLEMRCQLFPKIYYIHPFKNLACRLCNGYPISASADVGPNPGDKELKPVRPFLPWLPVYRSLFSVNSENIPDVNDIKVPRCSYSQIFDDITMSCRNTTCYPGKFMTSSSCQPLLHYTSNLRYRYVLTFSGVSEYVIPTKQLISDLTYILSTQIMDRLVLKSNPITEMFMQINQSCQEMNSSAFSGRMMLNLFISETVQRLYTEKTLLDFTNSTFQTVLNNNTIEIVLENDIVNELSFISPMPPSIDIKVCVQGFIRPPIGQMNQMRLVKLSKVLLCRQIEVSQNELFINLSSSQLLLTQHNRSFDFNQYDVLPSGNARICIEDFQINVENKPFEEHLSTTLQNALWYLTLICSIVSLIFLLLTLITYLLFPVLRTTPGKNNMAIITSLFVTQLLFQISKVVGPGEQACAVFGIALHFVWLMLFFYMNVASFHMFRLFHPQLSIKHHVSHKNSFLKYNVFAIVTPFSIVSINVVVFLSISRGSYTGYGYSTCFIDHGISKIVCFILPVGLTCLLNIFFFIATARNIHERIKSNRNNRADFSAICRLFTITGIAWLLQIIDGFFPFSAFSFIASLITSLQGLFIFIAFICTATTFNLYKTMLEKSGLSKSRVLFTSGSADKYTGEQSSSTVTNLSYEKKGNK